MVERGFKANYGDDAAKACDGERPASTATGKHRSSRSNTPIEKTLGQAKIMAAKPDVFSFEELSEMIEALVIHIEGNAQPEGYQPPEARFDDAPAPVDIFGQPVPNDVRLVSSPANPESAVDPVVVKVPVGVLRFLRRTVRECSEDLSAQLQAASPAADAENGRDSASRRLRRDLAPAIDGTACVEILDGLLGEGKANV